MKLKGSMLTPRGSTSERFQYRKIPWILTILTWRRAWRTTLRSCARTAEWRRRKNWRPVPKRSEISNHSVVQQSEIKCRGSMQRIRQPTIQPLRSSVCLIAALFVLTVAHRSDAQQREKVRVALGSISVNTSVIPIGHQFGVFAKYGVDLEPIYMGGGMNSLAAVTSNSVGKSHQGRMNALQRGSVVATALTPPFRVIAKQLGFRELIDLRKSDIEYAGSSIAGM